MSLRGGRWKIVDSNLMPGTDLGECDYDKKTIAIPVDGDTLWELDVCIHEPLHAAYPDLDEEAIDTTATGIARLLWRLGWRKVPEDER